MTSIHDLWKTLKFVSDASSLTEVQIKALMPVLETERQAREIRRIQYLLKTSGIKRIKTLEDFDWTFNPKIPREKLMKFVQAPWIAKAHNMVLIGPSGVGKSHITSSLCHRAIQEGMTTVMITSADLINKLKNSRKVDSLIQYYSTVKVFCLDELGYVLPTQSDANNIFQIISKRSELSSTLVTTNLVPSEWGRLFDSATATAILDRLSLNGMFLTFEGRSYRSKQ